jgi:hypothetical protein
VRPIVACVNPNAIEDFKVQSLDKT